MIFGKGEYQYFVIEDWAKMPPQTSFLEIAGIAVDSKDRVYVLNRSENPLMIFDSDGNFLNMWGKGKFKWPHGIFIAPDDIIYCTDGGEHTVKKFTSEGKLVMTLGTKDKPSDTGYSNDTMTIQRGGGPFNRPTKAVVSRKGEIYVSDGYGNARIHKFSGDGKHLLSWGEPGTGPGQFMLPHSLCLDDKDNVYVADRENSRIQVFNPRGKYITQWNNVKRPTDLVLDNKGIFYVTELGYVAGLPSWFRVPAHTESFARLTIMTLNNEVLASWGGENGFAPGFFCAPHTLAVDSNGDIYIGEVNISAGFPKCHLLQKFVRKK